MGSLYREKKNDLDEILLEVIHNSAETDKMFDAIFDENLKAIETQRDTETEDQLSPLLDQNLSEPDANIPYIKLPEKKHENENVFCDLLVTIKLNVSQKF